MTEETECLDLGQEALDEIRNGREQLSKQLYKILIPMCELISGPFGKICYERVTIMMDYLLNLQHWVDVGGRNENEPD